jgi:eukaryotic-like serine/threonine-protein kinase
MTAEFSVGQHVGDYEILSVLGLGGMGKVYKVRNVISDRVEAMKVLLPDLMSHQSLADRFLREIRLLASLNHPNIASFRTALSQENQLIMIMEFVEGETLANRLSRAPLSTADAINYSDQVLSALSYAHKMNIIHRDIKPANMMLTPQGNVKLMDFGIACSASDGTLTSTGTTLGSLNYMPPEQVRGESADARSDIYSFGVSLYEMLTGKLPFQADSQYSLMTAHLNQTPVSPSSVRSDLPPALSEIILMAMAKDPTQRFQSAEAFRAALKSIPVSSLPVSSTTVTPSTKAGVDSEMTLVETPLPSVSMPAMPSRATGRPTPSQKTVPAPPPQSQPAAATPFAPVIQSSVPSQGAPAPSTAGRGLWLALGSILGIGVLIAAGIYIPRKMHTQADQDKTATPSNSTGTPVASPTPAPATEPPAAAPPSVYTSQPPAATPPVAAPEVKSPAHGSARPNRDTTAQPPQEAAPAQPPQPSPEEISKLADEADQLGVRASTASASVGTLRDQQKASGYNLRGDIASAEQRMQMNLAKGNAALQAHDLPTAQKYFDMADADLTKLEKFLGH